MMGFLDWRRQLVLSITSMGFTQDTGAGREPYKVLRRIRLFASPAEERLASHWGSLALSAENRRALQALHWPDLANSSPMQYCQRRTLKSPKELSEFLICRISDAIGDRASSTRASPPSLLLPHRFGDNCGNT
jgi:hypothetical protein